MEELPYVPVELLRFYIKNTFEKKREHSLSFISKQYTSVLDMFITITLVITSFHYVEKTSNVVGVDITFLYYSIKKMGP